MPLMLKFLSPEFQAHIFNWEVNIPTRISTRHLKHNTFQAKLFISIPQIPYLSKQQLCSPSCSVKKKRSPLFSSFFIHLTFDPSPNPVVSTIQIVPKPDHSPPTANIQLKATGSSLPTGLPASIKSPGWFSSIYSERSSLNMTVFYSKPSRSSPVLFK